MTWLKTLVLCCYRKEAAQQAAGAEDRETQSVISDSSPEKKQKMNPKVIINKYIYKKCILGVRRSGSLRIRLPFRGFSVQSVFRHFLKVYLNFEINWHLLV
jgi:hypothetical protein